MSQPELHFDGSNLGDYALFGIRYLILPVWERPFAGAVPVLRACEFRLLRLPVYIRVADTVGSVTANRADIGTRTARYLLLTAARRGSVPHGRFRRGHARATYAARQLPTILPDGTGTAGRQRPAAGPPPGPPPRRACAHATRHRAG